ncbi:alpha/beta hydrolase [Kribbella sp.]|uniref:alpha/beta hydrolase n=1 Tax=Kribbella sp. TaxID=1871183 RepID=UPI002D55CC32|nr:alpha/beta hydrolase [Kribbella sp.]HZX02852.1 alpha/beta hydrolase [Kribbella sp.]
MVDPLAEAFSQLVGGGLARRALDRGDGRMLRWVEAGSGTPVVLEAGAMSPVATYAAVFRELVVDHRVVAYDRAGYGGSDPAPLSVGLQVGDLVALLEEVGPAVLVGHSWGGLLAQFATWERPDLIRGLVLLDPSHESFWEDAEPIAAPDSPTTDPRHEEALTTIQELAHDISRSLCTTTGAGAEGASPAAARAERAGIDWVEVCLSYLRTDAQWFTWAGELAMVLDSIGELIGRRGRGVWTGLPVVLLTATKGRPAEWTPRVVAVQEALARACDGRHQVVPESGHYLQIDVPELVCACVREVGP